MAAAVSAPGKVLLAGGYLVVDRAYTGLVLGLDARIHVLVETLETLDGVSLSEVVVRSPQFCDAEWRYGYRVGENDSGVEVVQLKGHSTTALSQNPFIETALAHALTYVSSHSSARIGAAVITILADSDYYSAGISARGRSSDRCHRFQDFNCSLKDANKTGLGSSAALVTAFIAAVVGHYIPSTLPQLATDEGKARLHNLAQAAHCAAQGKIGSGFDVAAAVYGACVYRRFSPAILDSLGNVGTPGYATRLKATVDDESTPGIWDTEIRRSMVKIPEGLRLVMCDVDCGSETPSMVKKVFAWREENAEEAALLWTTLQRGNDDLIAELKRLAESESSDKPDYSRLRNIVLTIRSLIREMSLKAQVPIEPRVQTDLLDACSAVPGVIGGVVPGAGGFDAIALLVEEQAIERLRKFVGNYRVQSSGTDGPKIGKIRLLGVKQETDGILPISGSIKDYMKMERL